MHRGISIKNVSFKYSKDRIALQNVSLEIKNNTFLGITGINGSGKSTFTYLLNGLIPHLIRGKFSGEVMIDGVSTIKKNVSYFARKVGMVFQNPDFSLFNLTVSEELEFGLNNLQLDNHQERIKKALQNVGLSRYSNRDPQTLSLGEKQKACLACVLALDASYIILDEPTAMLDHKSSLELYQILSALQKEGKTIITVEHDTDFLWKFANQVVIFDNAAIHSVGDTKKILSKKQLLTLGIKPPCTG